MVFLHLLLLEAASFIERRTFLSHFTFNYSYRLEKTKWQRVLCWRFVRSRQRGKDPSFLPHTVCSTTTIPLSHCSFLALLPLKTLQFVPDDKGGRCVAAWSNQNNYCGDKKRGRKDSQTLGTNMLSASCCCIWVNHHCGFVQKHFTSLPLWPVFFVCFFPSVTQFLRDTLCAVFYLYAELDIAFKTTDVSGEAFQS